ncbi:MAG: prepilin-type N-terminal cleavage/methylation domain-containing protein [Candidatus Riflebacteria bacterium]|nr:prepilin-type N-terminal cleavage/methylation domain-containing protein [Candidatus Riflebacteria bacterium]
MNKPLLHFRRTRKRLFRGFTIIEMLFAVSLSCVLMLVVYKFLGGTRLNFLYGTVNLQNMHEAQMAINYLRRDFSSSCPYISSSDPYLIREKFRRQILRVNGFPPANSQLIDVDPGGKRLAFYRFSFDTQTSVATPTVEPVKYVFDPARRALDRTYANKTITFDGFDDVSFRVYVHELNPKIPILWVKLIVNEGKGNRYGSGSDIGKPLEITTSITSAFVNSNINNLTWNFDQTHQ